MEVSVAGVLLCLVLLLAGRALGSSLIIGLFASLAFGSTAVASLPALGGASPLIYTVFAALLLLSMIVRRTAVNDLRATLVSNRAVWVLCALGVYAALGAIVLPRLFAGETSVFIVAPRSAQGGGVVKALLEPVSGNVTQTCYFIVGIVTFIALTAISARAKYLKFIRRGFFVWATLHMSMGLVDVGGKILGQGDVLSPLRTATYAMLTDQEAVGFFRIAGSYPEASAFGMASLAALAFTFTYWRATASFPALIVSAILVALIVLSTSTTAYVGAVILVMFLVGSLSMDIFRGTLRRRDLTIMCGAVIAMTASAMMLLTEARIVEPLAQLFDAMVFQKHQSISAQERGEWNTQGLQAFVDTWGLGVGLGSSRTSTWSIALLSQLGVPGVLLTGAFIYILSRGSGCRRTRDTQVAVLHDSARACAFGSLVGSAISGPTADPGMLFFVSFATVLACRTHVQSSAAPRVAASEQSSRDWTPRREPSLNHGTSYA